MEIKEGKLSIKVKDGKHWKKRNIKIDNKTISIPKEFKLDNSMDNKFCKVYLEDNKIIDIEIDGKKIDKIAKKNIKKFIKCKNENNFRVPNDTCLIIKNHYIDNFNLKLNKFTLFNDKDEAKIKDQKINENFFQEKWKEFYNLKIDNYYQNLQKLNLFFSETIELETNYRLLIGAEESIYETSIRLHHIYGIPFIPSSAIKGVVRSYIELEDKLGKWIDYFGSEEKKGKIVFFDAFPTTKPKIKVDVMTPHYNHYYNEGKAPTDDQNPVPINFLTVEDTKFNFFIASKEQIEQEFIDLFKKALTEHGIGAKTAVGYGYFKE